MIDLLAGILLVMAISSELPETEPMAEQRTVSAEPNQNVNPLELYGEPQRIRCTCYCDYGITKSGKVVREGIAAMNDEMLGKTAILYDEELNLIGIFEIEDTGGHEGLKNGTRIDIYRNDMDGVNEWIKTYGDYVMIQIIDAVG